MDGRVREKELHRCALTDKDVFGLLRQHGIADLKEVAYVIYEQRGQVSIIRKDLPAEAGLVREVVEQAESKR